MEKSVISLEEFSILQNSLFDLRNQLFESNQREKKLKSELDVLKSANANSATVKFKSKNLFEY